MFPDNPLHKFGTTWSHVTSLQTVENSWQNKPWLIKETGS
nr:MAG TPA: hypothetical protein [Caudoviricetes sp.]